MLDYGQDSVNIPKTFPTTTLGEKSSKGPRCQETKGVEGASARQKTPTKTSKDPSKVVSTPKGGEDRYNYEELMETIANFNMDVLKQGAEIEEMKLYSLRGRLVLEKERDIGAKSVKEAITEPAAVTAKEVETTPAAVTSPATKTELSREEIEIAETLVKAKLDTPKATQKAKGKMVEFAKASKKQSQIALDEELARKMQAELEKEEETQSAKDREIALEMSAKLNEEYQKSLKSAVAAKKVTKKASRQRLPLKTRQRQPSKTYLANQERRKMINFLKGAIGVPEGMFTGMSFGKLEELYQKEMAKLKGDFIQRVEIERKMKERHDLNIQQPFPDSEEGTPSKDKKEVKSEDTLAQQIGAMKRKKSISTKPKAKRARIEEEEKENERAETEAEPTVEPTAESEQNTEQSNQQSNEQFHLYMTLTNEDPVQVDPISMKAPEIIFWDILKDQGKEYFRIKRLGDHYEVYATWGKIIRSCSRSDLEEMHKVGMSLYGKVLEEAGINLIKIAMEYLCMMFEPERVKYRIKDLHHEYGFKKIDHWMLFENCGVYMITIDKSYHEYYLVDKIYDHSRAKLEGMLKAKLKGSEMARIVIRRTINQSLGLDPNLGN
ncbi:hypothetical protein L6452_32124 [Arctium lappa]|uniref:Uncharacterized protein n=1 Tax=Arctium lappa TaxID=4217 RepID=A0ACB8Z4U4_ARCLA|nr:hypothetical protein L6452_32124 [Arctium lappa]